MTKIQTPVTEIDWARVGQYLSDAGYEAALAVPTLMALEGDRLVGCLQYIVAGPVAFEINVAGEDTPTVGMLYTHMLLECAARGVKRLYGAALAPETAQQLGFTSVQDHEDIYALSVL